MVVETDPIGDDELLYRRVPVRPNYYDPSVDPPLSPSAFRPTKNDASGLSVWRAKFKPISEVVENPRGSPYYVAVLRAGDLRKAGIEVIPHGEPGHAELPNLTYETRKSDRSEELQLLLAEKLCISVQGPFAPKVVQGVPSEF